MTKPKAINRKSWSLFRGFFPSSFCNNICCNLYSTFTHKICRLTVFHFFADRTYNKLFDKAFSGYFTSIDRIIKCFTKHRLCLTQIRFLI